jgi:hypothetical protein
MVALALALAVGLTVSRGDAAPSRASKSHGVCSGYRFGAITDAHQTLVNDTPHYRGWALQPTNRLSTSSNGEAKFCLKRKGMSCDAEGGSNLIIRPKRRPRVIILYKGGSDVSCSTNKKNKPAKWCTTTPACITAHDPVFTVVVTRRRTTVKVVSGLVKLKSRNAAVVVGSMQQSAAVQGKKPNVPTQIHQTAPEKAATKTLAKQVPPPHYTRPPARKSPGLARIYKSHTIRVGIDLSDPEDRWTSDERVFITRYFQFLGKHWGVKLVSIEAPTTDVAGAELASGKIDVAVTSGYIDQIPTWDFLAFFVNPSGFEFDIVGPEKDPGLRNGLNGFLLQTVQAGVYGTLYENAFDRQPDYEIFNP